MKNIIVSFAVAIWNFSFFDRNPNVDERPTFCDIMQELQKSDFHILKWSTDDMSAYSPELLTLGSPLELGKGLYKDLQTIYLSKRVPD